ncbi:hypothetical protein [Nocardiopsis composta]|uniref:Uncharacterized protein n=1 Tax=Nocardiopsis composta TaxID=157465 RepID=A0A7W8QHW5_9ACTN|nr:hypothetical protein [Nocardiopsis composta]MBB5430651.1 hypothetical protein [Nocardiopsis composta]
MHLEDRPDGGAPPGGTHTGQAEWVGYREAAALPLFPAVGPLLGALQTPHARSAAVMAPPMTDATFPWR